MIEAIHRAAKGQAKRGALLTHSPGHRVDLAAEHPWKGDMLLDHCIMREAWHEAPVLSDDLAVVEAIVEGDRVILEGTSAQADDGGLIISGLPVVRIVAGSVDEGDTHRIELICGEADTDQAAVVNSVFFIEVLDVGN